MPEKKEADCIYKMSALELLQFVIENPEYLTDSYYYEIGKDIEDRFNQLCYEMPDDPLYRY